jgi:hypothetical protein
VSNTVHVVENGEDWFINLDQVTYSRIYEGKVELHFDAKNVVWFNLQDGAPIIRHLRRMSRRKRRQKQ